MQQETRPEEAAASVENVTGPRIVAALIDIVVLFISFIVLGALLGDADADGSSFQVSLEGGPFLLWVLLSLAYYTVPEALTGQTPGKAVMKLKVVRLDGQPYTWGNSLARNVLRIIDGLPVFYLLGLIIVATSKNKQRLGDMAAGTVVVRSR
jgi:uncharacterized RDD family membrane protein YckC